MKKVFSILLALALLAVAGYAMAEPENHIIIKDKEAVDEILTNATCTSYGTGLVKIASKDEAPKGAEIVTKKNGNLFYKAYINMIPCEWIYVTAGDPVCNAGGALTKVCKNCGATKADYVTIDESIHDYGTWTVLRKPTCTEHGLQVRICNRCLHEQYANIKVVKCNMVAKEDATHKNVAATCTDKGTEWYQCTMCKSWDSKETKALGHDYDMTKAIRVDREPSCTLEGIAVYKCVRCDVTTTLDLQKTAHKWEHIEAKDTPATCLTDGAVYEECKVCHAEKTPATKIAKTGHNWGEWKVLVAPSATTKGIWERFCQNKNCTAPAEHFVGSKLDNADRTNGLKEVDGEWIYVENDKPVTDKTGIVEFEGGKFLIVNGKLEKVTKLYEVTEGQFILLIDGKVSSYTGLVEYDGAWFYLENGKVATNVCGLKAYDGAEFVVANGQVLTGLNGLWQDHNSSEWFYIAAGKKTTYTGLAQYDGAWFYVTNGKLDTTFSGEVEYDGATFTVVNGMLAL